MSTHECNVVEVKIEEHPNADALELARVGDYLAIVAKGQYVDGDKVVYIPEQSVVPENILEEMNLTGRLAGKKGNRVKAMKLRGIVSQGLVYTAIDEWEVGQNVAEELGIEKYIPVVPQSMVGEAEPMDFTLSFDPENVKKFPDALEEGEMVVYTEKIHGTFCSATLLPEDKRKPKMLDGKVAVSSKKLTHDGVYFIEQEGNTYINAVRKFDVVDKLECLDDMFAADGNPVTLLGEVFGRVQDLRYGNDKDVEFRAFAIKVGYKYLDYMQFVEACDELDIPRVPDLYVGPHSKEEMLKWTTGREQVSGKEANIREGIVIVPLIERRHDMIGRVMLKSISDKYLLRKNATEYN